MFNRKRLLSKSRAEAMLQADARSSKSELRPENPLSQRTISILISEYNRLFSDAYSYDSFGNSLTTELLTNALYAMNYDKGFLDRCDYTYSWDFSSIFPALKDGTFWGQEGRSEEAKAQQRSYLGGFATLLCAIWEKHSQLAPESTSRLHESLARDGFRIVRGTLVPLSQDLVEEREEFSAVHHLLKVCGLDEQAMILSHFDSGQKQFVTGEYHACINEWRSFIEALLRSIWRQTRRHRVEFTSYSDTPPMRDVAEFLERSGFFASDEKLAFLSVWGFLSSGGHPGIAAKEDAHLSMFISLTFGHAALLKHESWQRNAYANF